MYKPPENPRMLRLEIYFKNIAVQANTLPALSEWDGETWRNIDFLSLLQKSIDFGNSLKKLNIRSGERILFIAHNRIQSVVALFGIWFANATAVLVDPDLPEPDLLYQCKLADVRIVITENKLKKTLQKNLVVEYVGTLNRETIHWEEKNHVTLSETV